MNILVYTYGSSGALLFCRIIEELLYKDKKRFNRLYEEYRSNYVNLFDLNFKTKEAIVYISDLKVGQFKRYDLNIFLDSVPVVISVADPKKIERILQKFTKVYFVHRDVRDVAISFLESNGLPKNEKLYKSDVFILSIINIFKKQINFIMKNKTIFKLKSFYDMKFNFSEVVSLLSKDLDVKSVDLDDFIFKFKEKDKDESYSLNRKTQKFDKYIGKFDRVSYSLFSLVNEELNWLGYKFVKDSVLLDKIRVFNKNNQLVNLFSLDNIVVYGGGHAYYYGLKDIVKPICIIDDNPIFDFGFQPLTLESFKNRYNFLNYNYILVASKATTITKMDENLLKIGVSPNRIFSILPIYGS